MESELVDVLVSPNCVRDLDPELVARYEIPVVSHNAFDFRFQPRTAVQSIFFVKEEIVGFKVLSVEVFSAEALYKYMRYDSTRSVFTGIRTPV